MKYHINKQSEPAPCTAVGMRPLAKDDEHIETNTIAEAKENDCKTFDMVKGLRNSATK